ncbi:alpha/beta fold hydrolase [Winogradskyella aurantiaca]|uniref:alpha/beta fold hydrolase n=1 Tax=Winogradskyella aurantiaca TaxID=2219558 RepID=UPI00130041CD|nr:dienelactone hydrolase family protein [Winogradskyella aurantiaca]
MNQLLSFLCFISIGASVYAQSTTTKFDYDAKVQPIAEVVSKQRLDSLTQLKKVVIDGFDSKAPFYLYENGRNKAKNYIFLLHGLGDSKDDWLFPSEPYLQWSQNTTAIKDSLLQLGYNLIIPDAKFHGERSYELGFRPPTSLPPVVSNNETDTLLFEQLMTSTVKDLRIIMDYIERNNADASTNFMALGYSMGGNLALLTSMFDQRITCVVACVPPLNLPARGLETFDTWSPKVIQGQLDITPMTHVLRQKSPLLLLMGKKDFYTTSAEFSKFYNLLTTNEKLLKTFNAGHILPDNYRMDAIAWFENYKNKSD